MTETAFAEWFSEHRRLSLVRAINSSRGRRHEHRSGFWCIVVLALTGWVHPVNDYCAAFKAWLATDRKQPPPCRVCAEASAIRARAAEHRRVAVAMEEAAARRIKEAHT